MGRLNQELYNASVGDIRDAYRNFLQFSHWSKTYGSDHYGDLAKATQKYIKKLKAKHKKDWHEDLPMSIIRTTIIKERIPKDKALDLMWLIGQMGYVPTPAEDRLFLSIQNAPEDRLLGPNASQTLRDIWKKSRRLNRGYDSTLTTA